MKTSMVTPEFAQNLGHAVLDFGAMESIIRTTVLVLSRDTLLAKALVPSTNAVSQNLELLRRLCHARVSPSALESWLAAIDDIQELFKERNKVFHGMFYEHEENLHSSKVKRGKRGAPDEWFTEVFDTGQMPHILDRLNSRRRQLMDFIDDYGNSDDGPAHAPSQESHPSLAVNK